MEDIEGESFYCRKRIQFSEDGKAKIFDLEYNRDIAGVGRHAKPRNEY